MKKTNQPTDKQPVKPSSTKAASKRPSTITGKAKSEPPRPKPSDTVEIQAAASIEVRVENKKIEYYINGNHSASGDILIRRNGKLEFVSNDGALAVAIEPALGKFKIGSAVTGKPISLAATPKGPSGAPGSSEDFKYSVAVFTGNAVICNDPRLKVFN